MTLIYDLEHITTYKYRNPVKFGEHKAIFLPTPGHNNRILKYSLETNIPSKIRWKMDTLSNNVALIEFREPGTELKVIYHLQGIHFGLKEIEDFPLDARAVQVPVQYTPDEWLDLSGFIRPHSEDVNGILAAWTKNFVAGDRDDTLDVLGRMMSAINNLTYNAREAEGTQSPARTLEIGSGTCRDFAWLMIESLRRLGFACRFVSGYLYDAALDGGEVGMTGSGSTHAWLEVYLPGAGWRAYDPTNLITAGYDLIQVAVSRHPGQIMPLSGSWFGEAGDYLGMDVRVTVRKLASVRDYDYSI